MDEVDEVVQEFLVESSENLDQLDRDLLALELDPGAQQILSSAFRTIHTIKGTSGLLAFGRLERLTHTGESLLSRLRDRRQTMTTPTADALLLMIDTVRELLASIEATGAEGEVEIGPAMARLSAQMREGDVSTRQHGVRPVPDSLHPDGARPSAAESSLRVDVDVLDALAQLSGQLALARDQLLREGERLRDPALTRTLRRLDAVTTELQESLMKTRMQPIDHFWAKLPRLVRDLAAQCGRQVRLAMTGQDIELDRALLEAIKDPITHLVRNAIDHGIEAPAERRASGKPAEGVVSLRAGCRSGQVVIEVADDGAGIDSARICAEAIERGLRTRAELAAMSRTDVLQLIFEPGLSTAETVTKVSGRGVGMDVVRTNVEAIGGCIEIESSPGEGTTCRLRIPLTASSAPEARDHGAVLAR